MPSAEDESSRYCRELAGEYEDQNNDTDYRRPFEKDRDRILYSLAFRRLGSITQVAAAAEVRLLHNRLTHSEKVAQVGRRLTQKLIMSQPEYAEAAGLDPDLTETAGLAHDLGHPPFGHVAERELKYLLRDAGGFEGNAQTFRIITKTGFKKPTLRNPPIRAVLPGFDLTRASLAAILKYPALPEAVLPKPDVTERSLASKAGVYPTETRSFTFARRGFADGLLAPTAILMDWSDDISYAVHDIEDHVRAGLVPFFRMDHEHRNWVNGPTPAIITRVEQRLKDKNIAFQQQIFNSALETILSEARSLWNYSGSLVDDYQLQDWVSARIAKFERAVSLQDTSPYVKIEASAIYEIELLKAITWEYVIDAPPLAAAQEGQRALIRGLFNALCDWLSSRRAAVPQRLKELHGFILFEETGFAPDTCTTADYAIKRAVTDFMMTLTEPQTIDLFQRLTGVSPATIFGGWL